VTNYSNGRALEYAVIADLEADGYRCTRAAGSKGVADIVALKPGEVVLIQAKRTNPLLAPKERAALLDLATYLKAVPIVAFRPPRKPIEYRRLVGLGPRDWVPWVADRVMDATPGPGEYYVDPNAREEYR
jgi:Holliday junction resolvase